MGEMDATTFRDEENWHGGFYELAILLGDRDDVRLDAAIGAVWADSRVEGCYADRRREPADQERVPCTLEVSMRSTTFEASRCCPTVSASPAGLS